MPLIAILEAVQPAMPSAGDAVSAFRTFAQTTAPLVVTALWQGIAIACALAICLRVAPRMTAAHRFALWISGFIALVCLPFVPLLSHFTQSSPVAVISSGFAEAAVKPWVQLDIRWSLVIAALWALVSIIRTLDLALHSFRLFRLWKTAAPVEPAATSTTLIACLKQLPGRKQVQICTTRHLDRPSVIGFFAPRILIPEWLLARLTPGELEQIVLHEAEHLRRRDDWTNLFQKLCLLLFPLNPALWWIERRLCAEREMACDDGVVKVTRAPRAYAACLTSLAERGLRRRAEALSLGAWQRRPELVHRVHSILTHNRTLSLTATRVLLAALSCGLVFGSVELARCPQLIAFVPTHHPHADQALAAVRTHSGQARLVDSAYTPALESKPAVRSRSHFHAIAANATLPGRASSVQSSLSPVSPAARETNVSSRSVSNSPRQVMLKAQLSRVKSNPVTEQRWIVFATWEQVQTTDPDVHRKSDPNDVHCANPEATGDKCMPAGRAGQVTVTRLIFRVIPVGPITTQPIPPVRDGWLVLQL